MVSLSSAEAPREWGRWTAEKKKVRLGRREDLSPASKLPKRPRSAKEASTEERGSHGMETGMRSTDFFAEITVSNTV